MLTGSHGAGSGKLSSVVTGGHGGSHSQPLPTVPSAEPAVPRPFVGSSRLHVLPHPQQDQRTLVVLIHGLGGHGYETWAELPQLLLKSDGPAVDVGVFDYTSGLRRIRLTSSASVAATIRELADEVVAARHSHVVLLGHSMGGVIAQQVVRHLFTQDYPPYNRTSKIAGLILMAAPRAGSLRVPWWVATKDARYLRAHSEITVEVDQFFTQHISLTCTLQDTRPRLSLPTFAGIATQDFWVDPFSAGYGIPADQKRQFAGSHSSIVKVKDPDDPVLGWIHEQLAKVIDLRAKRAMSAQRRSSFVLAVEFTGHPLEGAWGVAFEDARRAADSACDFPVLDIRSARSDVQPTVLLRAVRATECRSEIVRRDLLAQDARQKADGLASLGVAVVGVDNQQAASDVYELIGSGPPGATRWITGVADTQELRRVLHRWLAETADRITSSGLLNARADLRNDAAVSRELYYGEAGSMHDEPFGGRP